MDLWRWLWVGWIVAVAISFAVLEIAGYSRHGTLSEQVWAWLGPWKEWSVSYAARRGVLAFFLLWLALHFYFRVE